MSSNQTTDSMSDYYYSRTTSLPLDELESRAREELQKEGFGVLTEIDVQATLKQKLDASVRPYKILGACNPAAAYQALEAEPMIGVMLPCNVVIRENGDGTTEIAAVDPIASMAAVENDRIRPIAEDIGGRLRKVVDRI
jgi:uncharacterized protein (DUF302 family)